eukprot:7808008-Ditylum_brightwellii.AAC.1
MATQCERNRQCDTAVKHLLYHTHRNCDKANNAKRVIGEFLIRVAGDGYQGVLLEEDKQYKVCAAIAT